MKRIGSHRSYRTSRQLSPQNSNTSSQFGKSPRRRGQSLMRTQLSGQKLSRMYNRHHQTNYLENKQQGNHDDYYLMNKNNNTYNRNNGNTNNNKYNGNNDCYFKDKKQKIRYPQTSYQSRNRKIETNLGSKPSNQFKRTNTRGNTQTTYNHNNNNGNSNSNNNNNSNNNRSNNIKTVKSMKSLNTTDTNNINNTNNNNTNINKQQISTYASFYQMNAILQNACQQKPILLAGGGLNNYYCNQITQQHSNLQYQLNVVNHKNNNTNFDTNNNNNNNDYNNNNNSILNDNNQVSNNSNNNNNQVSSSNNNISKEQKNRNGNSKCNSKSKSRLRTVRSNRIKQTTITKIVPKNNNINNNNKNAIPQPQHRVQQQHHYFNKDNNNTKTNNNNTKLTTNNNNNNTKTNDNTIKIMSKNKQKLKNIRSRISRQKNNSNKSNSNNNNNINNNINIIIDNQKEQEELEQEKQEDQKKNNNIPPIENKQRINIVNDYQYSFNPNNIAKNNRNSLKKSQDDYCLPIQSKNHSFIEKSISLALLTINNNNSITTTNDPIHLINKIKMHLQLLVELAEYSKSMISMYQQLEDWQQLIFLVYKKYYLERLKVMGFIDNYIKNNGITQNPFILSICQITSSELVRFRDNKELKMQLGKLGEFVQLENVQILESLRNFYNVIIDKSGHDHINMMLDPTEKDLELCASIFEDMDIQLSLLEPMYQQGSSKKTMKSIGKRLNQIYRTAFLISELSGKLIISYEQSLQDDQKSSQWQSYIAKSKILFKKYLCPNQQII